MNSIIKTLFGLLFFFSNNYVFGQDLKEATINYFTKEFYHHYNNYSLYDNNIISDAKIKSIEKHQFNYFNDTIYNDILRHKFIFNTKGNPDYVFYKPIFSDRIEYFFKHDSTGNLVKKEAYGPSPEGNYKIIQSFEWTYDKYGFLTRQRIYKMDNHRSVKNGTIGFPEENFLYSNEDIVYKSTDSSALIILNNIEHCKDDSINRKHPDNFKFGFSTTLKFHSNNKLCLKTIREGDSLIESKVYDKCGNRDSERKPNTKCLTLLPNRIKCMTQKEIQICNELDTVTLNKQLVYFVKKNGNGYQVDSGPGTFSSHKSISYYNLGFKIIHSIDSTTYKRSSMQDLNKFTETKTVRINSYEYFDNGIQKKVITKDENGKVINVVEHKIEYYN